MEDLADALADWLSTSPDCTLEPGLSAAELARAQQVFDIDMPPLWQAVLRRVHPVELPVPPRSPDGVLRHTPYPDWRVRDEPGTRWMVESPVRGLLFDVEHNDFWWNDWGEPPSGSPDRLRVASERLAAVPRLTPLWSHWYVGSKDDSPVFSIVQADLYVPALTLADLRTGRDENPLPVDAYPIGSVTFWSQLHAYSQIGHISDFGRLAAGGL